MYLRPARMVRSASSGSFASPAFEKNPLAPARSRLTAYCFSACILTMRIGRSGRRRQSMATVSTTEASGREISSITTSKSAVVSKFQRGRARAGLAADLKIVGGVDQLRESQHEPARDRLRPRCAFSACLRRFHIQSPAGTPRLGRVKAFYLPGRKIPSRPHAASGDHHWCLLCRHTNGALDVKRLRQTRDACLHRR